MQTFTKEDIRTLLSTNDMAVVKGLEALYARQTADEQSAQSTNHSNGMGFNGTDAFILSQFAGQIGDWRAEKAETGRTRFPFPLSPKQLVLARRKILKYSGQLADVANAKAEVAAAAVALEVAAERAAIQEVEYEANRAEYRADTARLRAIMAEYEASGQADVDRKACIAAANAKQRAAAGLALAVAELTAERAAIQATEPEDEIDEEYDFGPAPIEVEDEVEYLDLV